MNQQATESQGVKMTAAERYVVKHISDMFGELIKLNDQIIYYHTKDPENPEKTRLENLFADKANKMGEAFRMLADSK